MVAMSSHLSLRSRINSLPRRSIGELTRCTSREIAREVKKGFLLNFCSGDGSYCHYVIIAIELRVFNKWGQKSQKRSIGDG